MAVSDAQKRATAKYVKEKVRTFTLRFFPSDADVLAHFEAQPEKAKYLKRLIREDMERRARED